MPNTHFILTGKGGVGKSYVSALLAQYSKNRGDELICLDTDPVNATFTGYEGLKVIKISILENGNVNPQNFDKFIEILINAPEDATIVVDNGAATFLPLCSYLIENNIIPYLENHGHTVKFHSVITGGQALPDTMNGIEALFVNFPGVPVMVWLNEYFGELRMNDKSVTQTRLFITHKQNVHAMITIPKVRKETFGYDIEQMLKGHLTFKEAINSDETSLMGKQRLRIVWEQISKQLALANL